eukprot:TRINITY_DN6457_c0_g1_i4.p1 TRINITY_DN6457_c0_g1~~TRINITY_DN6457_c0_g1_i4.p1  ORF type:complete len:451 (+),score=148.92 TRINITY_DN6457_c0_g1_i4:3-1355(+)
MKLGKKIGPANQTNVEYKSRGINMAAQSSLLDEKKGVAVTRRRVTLDELFGQLKHYNAQMRKDALLGIKELCTSHLDSICLRLREVFEASLKAVADVERVVRQSASTLYRKLLKCVPLGAVLPFLKLLVMYTAQALTHLQLDVRLDALGFLEVVLEHTHTAQTHSMFESLTPTLLDMLTLSLRAGNTQGSAAKMCSPEARSSVLKALIRLWGSENNGTSEQRAATQTLTWQAGSLPQRAAVEWLLYRQPLTAGTSSDTMQLSRDAVGSVGTLMMQAFAECAVALPLKEAHVQCMLAVLQLTTALAANSDSEVSAALAPELETHVLPHLPFEAVRNGTDRCALCVALCSAVAALTAAAQETTVREHGAASQTVQMLLEMLRQTGGGGLDLEQLAPAQLDSVLGALSTLTASGELPASSTSLCFQGLLELSGRLHPQSQARCAVLKLSLIHI